METLFLKYRPLTFNDIVGQKNIVQTLQNSVKNNIPVHSYLFIGTRGTGKTSTARILAKALNCKNLDNGSPCGKCDICAEITDGSMVDVIEIDAASNTSVDNVRDLIDKVRFQPSKISRKIYIIDEVHMLSKSAFNALLKTLEEPPEHAYFILATTELHKVPQTIVSRCQTFLFTKFSLPELVSRLKYICEKEKFTCTDNALNLIAQKAEGGMRDAISLLEQLSAEFNKNFNSENVRESLGLVDTQTLETLWDSICNNETQQSLDLVKNLSHKGVNIRSFCCSMLNFLREKLYQNLQSNNVNFIIKGLNEFTEAIEKIKFSPIPELPLEIAIINLNNNETKSDNTKIEKKTQTTNNETFSRENLKPSPKENSPEKNITPENKTETKHNTTKSTEKKDINNDESTKNLTQEVDDGFVWDNNPSGNSSITKKQDFPKTEPLINQKTNFVASENKPVATKVTTEKLNLSVKRIKESLHSIAKKAKLAPAEKMAFCTLNPAMEENTIIFTGTNFYLDKVNTNSIQISIEKATREFFDNSNIIIKFSRENLSAKNNSTNSQAKETNHKPPKEELATIEDLLNF